MSAAELVVRRVYVLRGLMADGLSQSSRIPPAVGRLERVIHDDAIVVKLWMGPHRWAPKARICRVSNVAREATRREAQLGFPVEPLPAVAS